MPFFNLLLSVREHATHALCVALSNLKGLAQLTLTLRLLFSKNVIEMGLSAFESTLARFLEALGCAPIGFHLRHFNSFGLATYRGIPAATGG